MTATAADRAVNDPTELVSKAVKALEIQFFEPVDVADLLRDAWAGATAALRSRGAPSTPVPPAFPADPHAAYSLHEEQFPTLVRLADGHLSGLGPEDLATAALEAVLAGRRDGHTFLHAHRRGAAPRGPDAAAPAGWSIRSFGLVLTDRPPLAVADVEPRGPAQRAGVRRGQEVVAINGVPAAQLRRFRADALLDYSDDAANSLVLRAPGGDAVEVELRSTRLPMPVTEFRAGPFGPRSFGLVRLDAFSFSATETQALRAAFTAFEDAGARGWIVDMRWNRGGGSIHLSRLLLNEGRLISRQRHNEVRLPDGTVLPARQDIDCDGTALPFQRPLVVLIGPGSISGAESLAGPLRAHGRATLVGERTAGLCGVGRSVEVAPGWGITLASHHTAFGPDDWALNRVGVPPDVEVRPTQADEVAGRDPQVEAALDILRAQTAAG